MSSDEEDEDAPFRRYGVPDVDWRSDPLTKVLRTLDALHRRWRKKSSKRGAQPRMRYLANVAARDSTRAVRRLPQNAYTQSWYEELRSFEKDDLNVRPTDFDFEIPQEIKKYALLECTLLTVCSR